MEGGSNAATGLREGDVLDSKYRVGRVLGTGGMGVVVAAHHLQLDEKVAIKYLKPEALGKPEAAGRFAREARAAVRIKSEHVARVIDVGTLPNGAPYMVMEYLEGRDLAVWLKERGALAIEQAVEFILQTCVAVADAHALGIVHRDLKPANLFCVRRSDAQLSIKVLDFGISKMTEASGMTTGSVTDTQALMGSPLYMSPEQMRSTKEVDAQTDIWSLGVILFELLAGRPPFLGTSLTQLVLDVANRPAPALTTLRPEAPAELEAILFRCLEKDRRKRYGNVAELAVALLPFAPRRGRASVERIEGIIEAAGLSTRAPEEALSPMASTDVSVLLDTGTALGKTNQRPRGRPVVALVVVLAVSLCAVLAVSVAVFAHRRGSALGQASAGPVATGSMGVPAVPSLDTFPTPALEASTTASAEAAPPVLSASVSPRGPHAPSVPTTSPRGAPTTTVRPGKSPASKASAQPQEPQEHDVF